MIEIEKLKKLSETIQSFAKGLAIPDYAEEAKIKAAKEAKEKKYAGEKVDKKASGEYSVDVSENEEND